MSDPVPSREDPKHRQYVQEFRWNLVHGFLSKMPGNLPGTWGGLAAVVGYEVVNRIRRGPTKKR